MLRCIICGPSLNDINPDELFFYPIIAYALLLTLPFALWQMRFAFPLHRCRRCKRCGYNLTGNADAGCPECGWGRETINTSTH